MDTVTPFLWTGFYGNQTDSNGLVYLRNRYYNVLTRSFVNSDPAREGWNWYAYGAGNPLSFVDPTGLGISSALDYTQTALSALGMIPIIGNVFDIVNAGISLARGNYVDFTINLAAALPGIGQMATGAKFAGATASILGAVRTADRTMDTFRVINKVEDAGGLTLFKWGEKTTTTSRGWKTGDRMLHLPDQGTPKLNWKQNASALRREMRSNEPIFDSYRNPMTGEQIPTKGFLNAERKLLESKGWKYDPATGAYHPPSG